MSAGAAQAGGGRGGDGGLGTASIFGNPGSGGGGGEAGSGGANGNIGSNTAGNGGGGGGGAGGFAGGAGATGGTGGVGGDGGMGGAHGAVIPIPVVIIGARTGADGGNGAVGGNHGSTHGGGGGGGGGEGGHGVAVTAAVTVTNSSVITGGHGGQGGLGGVGFGSVRASSGYGGTGGAGLSTSVSGVTVINNNDITGGDGGSGRGDAAGGVGVTGSGLIIINSGTISGGLSSSTSTRANAIVFTSGTNTLELRNGSTITGNVVAGGSSDTLVFGGDTTPGASFDAGQIGTKYTGFERLSKTGTSTWSLTGTSTFTGGTTVEAGTLRAGSAGAFAANTAYTVNGGTLDLNGHALTMSALSGTGGTVALGNAGLTVNQSGTTSYGGVISGTGSLTKSGAGTLTLTGANTHSGGTTVSAGRLVVNGSVGAVTLNGGSLGGSGTIGGFTANSGSTIAPGNSIGTLNVTGNTSFASGSTYAVEVDKDGNSDRIAATGAVTIDNGATVSVSAENGTDDGSTYAPSTTYTIITAGTGVTGTFGSVSENFAFLDAALGYTASAVTLTLTRNASNFVSVGRTANQRAVASGVASLTAGNAVYDAVVGLSADGARTAFDSLSGEIYPSTAGRFVQDSHFARNAASNRIRSAFEGLDAGAMPMTSFGGSGGALNVSGGAAVWGQAYGSWGNTRGNGNAAAMGHSTGGLFVGADVELFDAWRGGLMAGYGNAGFNVGPRSSSSKADSYTFGAYAGGQVGSLGVRLGASYALHDVATSRNVAVGALSNALSADYRVSTTQAFGEAGYSFHTPLARFEPFAGFALIHQRSGAFTESGGAAALSVAAASQTLGFTTLGLRAERQLAVGEAYTATVSGSLGWSHVIGDPDPASTMRFAGGNAFRISGTPLDRDTAQLEAGLKFRFANDASLNVDYIGELGARTESHAVAARFSKAF